LRPRWGEHYRLTGQKIFITYGDHDLAPNIVHMVLARTPDAPPGRRGISLFYRSPLLAGRDYDFLPVEAPNSA
jgi:alkylation response protein AidB-like acyl-CoA dehydrogenase